MFGRVLEVKTASRRSKKMNPRRRKTASSWKLRWASGATRMKARGLLRKCCSKDAVIVRDACLRKSTHNVSTRGSILNALPVLMLTPGL